jgi:hypothetical protein
MEKFSNDDLSFITDTLRNEWVHYSRKIEDDKCKLPSTIKDYYKLMMDKCTELAEKVESLIIPESKFKIFEDNIKMYQKFIDDKIGLTESYYKNKIEIYKKIILLLTENTMTPEEFSKFDDRTKWEISSFLTDVIWCCGKCNCEVTDERPARACFDGEEHRCSVCDVLLTRRTGGGQGDPCNYTFKSK